MHPLLKITKALLFIKVELKQEAANPPFEGPSKLQIVRSPTTDFMVYCQIIKINMEHCTLRLSNNINDLLYQPCILFLLTKSSD